MPPRACAQAQQQGADRHRPARYAAGHGRVGTAWVAYQPGNVLEYRELLAAS